MSDRHTNPSQEEIFYIQPEIRAFNNIESLFQQDRAFANLFFPAVSPSLADINAKKIALVIGEPGYGKSVLLERLKKENPRKSVLLDCRDLGSKSRLDLFEQLSRFGHAYFDGLDEVPPLEFMSVLDAIGECYRKFPDMNITVACRSHYVKRFSKSIAAFQQVMFYQIEPFSEQQIREYLDHYRFDAEVASALLNKSKGIYRSPSILSTPRYLHGMVASVRDNQITAEEIANMRRTDIFERVVYYKLLKDVEKKQKGAYNEIHITQRVLEKLAFIMEIYQRNQISRDEFITYLDQTNSNITLMFLHSSSIEEFIERTMKDVGGQLMFEHTEIQEYLAAKELVRVSNSDQVLYDLILQKDLKIIYLNWYDVLQYALELDPPRILNSMSYFINSNPSRRIDDRLVELLLGSDAGRTDGAIKTKLFSALFGYHQVNGLMLYQRNDALASFFSPAEHTPLLEFQALDPKNDLNTKKFFNRALLISSLSLMGRLDTQQSEKWKTEMVALLSPYPLNDYLSTVYYVLTRLGAGQELIDSYDTVKKESTEQLSYHLSALAQLCADRAMPVFLDIIEHFPLVSSKEDFPDHLTTPEAINEFLDLLERQAGSLQLIFSEDYGSVDYYNLFQNVREISDSALDEKIKHFFLRSVSVDRYVYARNSLKNLLDRALGYTMERSEEFLDDLLALGNSNELVNEFAQELTKEMSVDRFNQISDYFAKQFDYPYTMRNLVHYLRHSGNERIAAVNTILAAQHPDLFAIPSSDVLKKMEQKRKEGYFERFKRFSIPGPEYNKVEMVKFYYHHADDLEELMREEDAKELINQLSDMINLVDPDQYHLSLERKDSMTLTFYPSSNIWFNFSIYFRLALRLNQLELLRNNRMKIIKFIPSINHYMSGEDDLLAQVMDHLGEISAQETAELLEFCLQRKDDYLFSAVKSFSDTISRFKMLGFKPLLKRFLDSPLTDVMDKEGAVIAFGKLSENTDDKKYLEEIFDKKKNLPTVMVLANEYLISKFLDPAAVHWRFRQLRKVKTSAESADVAFAPLYEHNPFGSQRSFASCLSDPAESHFDAQMFELLRWALVQRRTGNKLPHSDYLLKIIADYFKKYLSLSYIQSISAILAEPGLHDVADSFKAYLAEMEQNFVGNYMLYTTISEPIKVHNRLNDNRYLTISSVKELQQLIGESLDELEDFITLQGYKKPVQQLSGNRRVGKTKLFNEDILQKTLKLYLENTLLKRGLRETDIQREAELFDGKRTDMLINYGFIGPVVLELKLLHNEEITNEQLMKKYKTKLKQYMAATGSDYGFYIIFKTEKSVTGTDMANYGRLVKEYADLQNVRFRFIDCIG